MSEIKNYYYYYYHYYKDIIILHNMLKPHTNQTIRKL